ncbi:hypothetical protein KI387_028994 [Taxus chinensis]|uniref:Sialate O-acetylesterase domain-containing protein n=1 Tax=Taxus chinensis TaxID=29808 RepID=A0AA38FD28_TAXCH|nr:hypothetical protein KI387_028994 [Taxus chinensis]
MDIFVLSGQSNMAGRGGVFAHKWDSFVPPHCQSHSSILRLHAHLHWEEAHVPLHADIDKHKICGVGPGMSFANTVLKHYKDSGKGSCCIGLVPCAIGGTAMREWEKGGSLYNSMIHRTKVALSKGGVLRGILWYQGESDAEDEKSADCYQKNLERFIHDVRSDLQYPNLLFIQVAITAGDPPFSEHVQKVREAQLGINIPNVYCVDAKGLPLKEDKLHLTTEAQVQLGKMLADAYLKHGLSQDCPVIS